MLPSSAANGSPPLSLWNKIGYGLGDTAANLVWRTMLVFLPIFYTDVFKLRAVDVGILLLVCRYFDGISDVAMGIIADRTSTRWGRYRPWILWTALPFGLATVLTFTTPSFDYAGRLVYAYVTYTLLVLIYTANNIPYAALTGAMSDDPIERMSLSSWRFACAFLGGLIVQGLVIYLVSFFGHGDTIRGYKHTMTLFAGLSVVLFAITFLATREKAGSAVERSSWLADLKDLVRNGPWLALFCVGIMMVLGVALKGGATMYYFKYYVGHEGLAAPFMICGLVASMVGTMLTKPLAARFGKKPTLIGCLAATALASLALYRAGPGDTALIFSLGTLGDFAMGPAIALFFAMLADTADYSEWKNRRRATGLVFSAGTVAIKFGAGMAGAIGGLVLARYGYVANAAQTTGALTGIRILMAVLSGLAAVAAIVFLAFYKLNETALAPIRQDLSRQRVKPA